MMLNDNEPTSVAELKKANRELTDSLRKCQDLVTQCREQLAANGEESFLLAPRTGKTRRPGNS